MAKTKLKFPRVPLPRQTEKVHSARKRPLPPVEHDQDYYEFGSPYETDEERLERQLALDADPWEL